MSRLQKGDKPIAFILPDYRGNSICLPNYRGKKILLSFLRGASCPFTLLRIEELIDHYNAFEKKGIRIVTFVASSVEAIDRHAGKQDPSFPVIPDPSLAFHKAYGVESSHLGMIKVMLQIGRMFNGANSGYFNMNAILDEPLMPADFLIDENFIIQRAYYGRDFGDNMPIDDILT